jgi:hypothetical protein
MTLPALLPFVVGQSAPSDVVNQFDQDRFRFIVEEKDTGIIVRDLIVRNAKVMRVLSGACVIQGDIHPEEPSAKDIYFKPWKHWIHVEKKIAGVRKIWASGLVQPSQIDQKTGMIKLEAKGFADYPKGLPWLENWNPLACDAFEGVHKIWAHLQSYPQGNLGVTVSPAESGIIMLPGYAFDGNIFNLNFWAEFIRAVDKQDCGKYIDKMARDIPFDYMEKSAWNAGRTAVTKEIVLGYPKCGVDQPNLVFAQHENVIEFKPHLETEIDWASDAIVDGWWPGKQYSSTFTNADTGRYRRTIYQDDARINSNERAAVWARRKLTRRQTPAYWESIIVDMNHPNAPFGSCDVGDRIMVRGEMPLVGDVVQQHKIIAIAVEEASGTCMYTLKAEGAFNYDPIFFQGDVSGSITVNGTVPSPVTITSDPGVVGMT